MQLTGFEGKTALVTGGASGIGLVVGERLAKAGTRVVLADINGQAAEVAAERFGSGHRGVELDVGDADAVSRVLDDVATDGLHFVVNSAGVVGTASPLGTTPTLEWTRINRVNYDGVFHVLNATFRHMLIEGGAIVNVASVMGARGAAGHAAYSASKHGLVGLTKAAAADGAPFGIRVNAVGPGYVDTPMQAGRMSAQRHDEIARRHMLGRWAAADEIAPAICWLLSDEAGFVTGAFHMIDGGFTAL